LVRTQELRKSVTLQTIERTYENPQLTRKQ